MVETRQPSNKNYAHVRVSARFHETLQPITQDAWRISSQNKISERAEEIPASDRPLSSKASLRYAKERYCKHDQEQWT